MTVALVPFGLSGWQLARHVGWATRRLTYGDRGTSPAGLQRAMAASHRRRRPTCRAGHRWTQENTYIQRRQLANGQVREERGCKACSRIRYGRRARLRRARRRLLAAHPDVGGTFRQFRQALRQLRVA